MNQTGRAKKVALRIPLLAIGIVLVISGLAAIVGFGSMQHIICTRTDAVTTCKTRVSFMGFLPLLSESTLKDVRHAEVSESCSDHGELILCSYPVVITYADGKHQLNGHFFSKPSAIEIADDINLLKEASANCEVLRKNIQNRALLGLGWLCVSGPLLILGSILLVTLIPRSSVE